MRGGKVTTGVPQPFQPGDTKFQLRLDTTRQVATSALTSAQGILISADRLSVWLRPAADTNRLVLPPSQRVSPMAKSMATTCANCCAASFGPACRPPWWGIWQYKNHQIPFHSPFAFGNVLNKGEQMVRS